MEEQKKEELEQITAEDTASGKSGKKGSILEGATKRTLMLWCLGGGYLLWTGYNLCKNVINGVDGGGIGFFLAGVVFAVIGGALLFFGIKGVMQEDKLRKEQEAAAAAEAEELDEGIEEVMEETPSTEPKKKMTIAERASLARRLEEEDADETEE